MATKHRYFVEYSSPSYRNAGNVIVLASTKAGAVSAAKKKIGAAKIKEHHLHHFDSWRISGSAFRKP